MGDQAPHAMRSPPPSSVIGQAWDRYRSMVVPAQAGAIQIRECRSAFYAGASSLLDELIRIEAGPPGVPATEDQVNAGAMALEGMRLELEAFARSLTDFRAPRR